MKVDFEELRKLWLLDKRVGESHSRVTAERGFGGSCFPKDLQAIIGAMEANGGAPLLEALSGYNARVRRREDLPIGSRNDFNKL
jgi:UDP-glucose 6-dehydrogenase